VADYLPSWSIQHWPLYIPYIEVSVNAMHYGRSYIWSVEYGIFKQITHLACRQPLHVL